MGCGGSKAGVMGSGGGKWSPKKDQPCLAPCPWDNDEDHFAIVMEEKKDDNTFSVYFPEYEPQLTSPPKGTGEADLQAFAEEKKLAIKNMVPGLGKKVSRKDGFTADQLKESPYPQKIGQKTLKKVGIPDLDEILDPAGAIITTLGTVNDSIYGAWDSIFKLEKKYDIPFPMILRCLSGTIDTEDPAKQAIDACKTDFEKDVATTLIKLLMEAKKALETLPSLVESMSAIGEKAEELTKEEEGKKKTDKLKEMCESAGLPPLEQMKAVKNAVTNLMTVKDSVKLLNKLVVTCKFSYSTLKTSLSKVPDDVPKE